MSVLLTTTGAIGTVTLRDLGDTAFVHPVTDFVMFPTWQYAELAESVSLGTALDAGYVTINNSGDIITTSTALKDIQPQTVSSETIVTSSSAPTNLNDSSQGHFVGKRWIHEFVDPADNVAYICLSAQLNQAIWQPVASNGVTINEEGDIVINTTLVLDGGLQFGPAITIDINANTDNLVITGLSSGVLVRLNLTGNYSLSGIQISDTTKGHWIKISNVGIGNLTLKDNDAGSLAANRFLMGSNKSLQPNENIGFIYDTVSLRLRPDGINI